MSNFLMVSLLKYFWKFVILYYNGENCVKVNAIKFAPYPFKSIPTSYKHGSTGTYIHTNTLGYSAGKSLLPF